MIWYILAELVLLAQTLWRQLAHDSPAAAWPAWAAEGIDLGLLLLAGLFLACTVDGFYDRKRELRADLICLGINGALLLLRLAGELAAGGELLLPDISLILAAFGFFLGKVVKRAIFLSRRRRRR